MTNISTLKKKLIHQEMVVEATRERSNRNISKLKSDAINSLARPKVLVGGFVTGLTFGLLRRKKTHPSHKVTVKNEISPHFKFLSKLVIAPIVSRKLVELFSEPKTMSQPEAPATPVTDGEV